MTDQGSGAWPIRGRAAIVGIGETEYTRWGKAQDAEFKLTLRAILTACEDANIDPRRIDGFASFSDDRNFSVRLAGALNITELRHASMVWGGGGGGGAGAVLHAAMAVATGTAECVVVLRGLAQGQFARFGAGGTAPQVSGEFGFTHPYGLMTAAQIFAMRWQRWMHEHGGVGLGAQKAISLAAYAHAQNNPRVVMFGKPLTEETYDDGRWIVEPWRLYDCCQENDGAAAIIVMAAEKADPERAAYILGAAHGASQRHVATSHNGTGYGSSNFSLVADRLWSRAGVKPTDIDVVQSYENFTGGVVMSLVEHGICEAEEVDEVLTLENLLAPSGKWPLNTSGGNLAECYMHGLELVNEAVRQLRGESCNQVPLAGLALVSSGPMTSPVSDLILGRKEAV